MTGVGRYKIEVQDQSAGECREGRRVVGGQAGAE